MTRAAIAGLLTGVLVAACTHPTGASPSTPSAAPTKSAQLNQPGEMVDVTTALVPGYVTVVDFWGDHCGACSIVGGMLAVQVAHDARVLIRKVDIGDGFSPVARAYGIGALPHFRVFDKHQKLRFVLVGNDTLKAPDIAKQLAAEP